MSAEVPPTSSVMTLSKPAARPTAIPPMMPATGPDISSCVGRASAVSTVRVRGERAQPLVHTPQVAARLRSDVGVQCGGREALVLTMLGSHLVGDRHVGVGHLLGEDLLDA